VHLAKNGCRHITLSTRRAQRGEELARQYSIRTVPFSEWRARLAETDLLISATTSSDTLLFVSDLKSIMAKRSRGPLCLIDLAVPRTVDAEVSKVSGVDAFNIEDLKGIAYQNLRFRENAMAQAYAIIDARAAAFLSQLHSPDFSSMVSKLNQIVQECVRQEVWPALEPYLLSDTERKTAEQAVNQLERSLAHNLLMRLKTRMLEEESSDSEFLMAKIFQNDPVQVNLPEALKKYPDQFMKELKNRFHREILSLVTT
jgi:glutamyl-tRNA reductase